MDDRGAEQDLIISRAVVCMFAESEVSRLLAFRGGTARYYRRSPCGSPRDQLYGAARGEALTVILLTG